MAFTVSIDGDHQLVHIVHHGDIDARDLFLGREALGRELNQHQFRRALVDVRQMDTPPDTMDTFELSSSHHNHLPANTRIAVIVNPHIEPDARFSENVAHNRGWAVCTFTDADAAQAWLLE